LFIKGLGSSAADNAFALAIVTLARALDLSIVAEGVETQEQLDGVREIGCETAQGYLFARPLPPAEIVDLAGSASIVVG
jgi:EAL domain-containing protein (putative c-di-GMP-specific phosphodiesterase class I)